MLIKVEYLKNSQVVVHAKGKLDIYTTNDYLDEVKKNIKYAQELILDFSQISYIASIGLRAILELNKAMQDKNANMIIKNVCNDVLNIFKITGFDDFLNIENDTDDEN